MEYITEIKIVLAFLLSVFRKSTATQDIWATPCGATQAETHIMLPIPVKIEDAFMIRSSVIVMKEAKAVAVNAKSKFISDKLLSRDTANNLNNLSGKFADLNLTISEERSNNTVDDIQSDYTAVSVAMLYLEDIIQRTKTRIMCKNIYKKSQKLHRKLQNILCIFYNILGNHDAHMTEYISRSLLKLPIGDVADLLERDYLVLDKICKFLTALIKKYSA